MIAEAIKSLLEPEFEVVGIASDGHSLVDSVAVLQPDIVVLDIAMPLLNGLDAGQQIRSSWSGIKLIYVTMASDPYVAAEAFRRGASGYVLKHGSAEELLTAVRRTLRGESYVSSLLDKHEVEMHIRLGTEPPAEKKITSRQTEILRLIAEGKSLKEVGEILRIKSGTAAFHKYRIMEILGIRTNADLLAYAIKHHIIPRPN